MCYCCVLLLQLWLMRAMRAMAPVTDVNVSARAVRVPDCSSLQSSTSRLVLLSHSAHRGCSQQSLYAQLHGMLLKVVCIT